MGPLRRHSVPATEGGRLSAAPTSGPAPRQPLGARARGVLGAHTPLGGRVHRALFATAVPLAAVRRVRRSDHPSAPRLARAVEAIRGRGIEPEEARWVERIERHREAFAARRGDVAFDLLQLPPDRRRRIASPARLARVSSIHRPWGMFLMRLARELRPGACIELGGAIGISAAYQGAALEINGRGRLVTVEGSPQLAGLARETLDELGIDRVEVVTGTLDDVLPGALAGAGRIDLAFMDASKSRDGTLAQFEQLLPHLAPGAALLIDDVHWSREMNRAWREIRSDARIGFSVDLWRLGACLPDAGA